MPPGRRGLRGIDKVIMSLSARSAFQRLWPYVRPVAGITALGFLATALVAATEAYVPAFLRRLLDEGFSPHAPQSAWWSISLTFLGLACLRGVAQFSSSYLLGYVSNNVVIRIREAMIERVVRAGAPFFQRETASTIINAVVSEANQVLLIVTSALVTSVQGALTVIGYLAYLFYLNWRLTLVIAVVLPGIGWLAGQINRRMRRLNREQQAMTNDLSYVVEEIVSGYKVVKVHGGEQYEIDRFMAMSRRLKGYAIRGIASGGLAQSLTQLLASIAIAVVIAISIYQALHGHGNGNDFMTYILATLLAISPLKQLMSVNQPLQRGMTAAELPRRSRAAAGSRRRVARSSIARCRSPTKARRGRRWSASPSRSGLATWWRWLDLPAAARRRWPTCCRASSIRPAARYCSTACRSRSWTCTICVARSRW